MNCDSNHTSGNSNVEALPLFVMEEQCEGKWKPIHFWLLTFRDIVENYAYNYLCLPQFRVRRVRNWEEAKALEDVSNTRTQLPMLSHNRIKWVAA